MESTMNPAGHPEPGRLARRLIAWLPFSLGMAAIVFASLAEPSVVHARTRYSIWLSLLLAAPALALYARDVGVRPLGNLWRLLWSLSFAAYAFHFWYGFGVMFGGDIAAVMASQGVATALFNYAVSLLWAADVASAWCGFRGKLVGAIRGLAHGGVLAAGLISTIIFRDDEARVVGVILLAAVLAAGFRRWRGISPALH